MTHCYIQGCPWVVVHYGDPAPKGSRSWSGHQGVVSLCLGLEGQVSDQANCGHTTTPPGLCHLHQKRQTQSRDLGKRPEQGTVFPPCSLSWCQEPSELCLS